MAGQIVIIDERLLLETQILRVFFRASEPILTAAIKSPSSGFNKTALALSTSGEYACRFDLSDVPEGNDYQVWLRGASGSESCWGKLTAVRQEKVAAASREGATHQAIAKSAFQRNDRCLHASIHLDLKAPAVHFRLTATDDIDPLFEAGSPSQQKSHTGSTGYSVVTAVYNVDKYLDDYFKSITSQLLDFELNIELVLVDDGSTDRSLKKIKRWQRKFPNNIRYLHKPNGGPASARNAGLALASREWVTFIDPDDFVEPDYFAVVSRTIERYRETIAMVCCNIIFYYERSRAREDTHPLRFRFAQGERLAAADDLGRSIQMSAATAFFRRDLIDTNKLAFDEQVRPNFEDAHFAGRYLMRATGKTVAFVPQAQYIYRRREDGSSLLQTGALRPELYSDQIRYGYIGLLREATTLRGKPPRTIQMMVLYSLCWHFERIVDHPEAVSTLSHGQRQMFLNLLAETFSYIDPSVIADYDVYGLPFAHRVGILGTFKNSDPPVQRVEVTEHDRAKKLVKVIYWSRLRDVRARFSVNDLEEEPAFDKVRRVDFLGSPFCWEHISWLRLSEGESIKASFAGRDAEIYVRGASIGRRAGLSEIRLALAIEPPAGVLMPPHVRELRRVARLPQIMTAFKDAWLFMDRDTAADDSAEHLYRYVRRQAPQLNTFFILKRNSPDWMRLAREGFRLMGFNEAEHAAALLNATHLISSQADHYVVGYLGDTFRDAIKYKFTFLQHGIIKDDISGWLNRIKLDCFITSTRDEFASIVGDGSAYKFTEKEVVLTGLPRHDALLEGPRRDSRTIVIMPTWRLSLSGAAGGAGNERAPVEAFFKSHFARQWRSLLHSPRLTSLAEKAGCRVVFVPHPNLEQYLDYFVPPRGVEVRRFGSGTPISGTFEELSLFVTDYSSKAFDAAYLDKPLVYYQADPDDFFGGGHTSGPGYFDYDRDGFGPVRRDEGGVLDAIETMLSSGGEADALYRERAARTFVFRDGRCCERVFKAILALDQGPTEERPPRLNTEERSSVELEDAHFS